MENVLFPSFGSTTELELVGVSRGFLKDNWVIGDLDYSEFTRVRGDGCK